jgi:glycosyltransferase involved in cell wall biosynthesis
VRIAAFPFHDWRKGEVEGIRWRDGHLLETIGRDERCERLLIVDRPVSLAERLSTRRSPFVRGRTIDERRSSRRAARITEVREGIEVLDMAVPDLIGPAIRGRGWWFDIFDDRWVLESLDWAVRARLGPRPAAMAWTPTVASAIERLDPARFLFDSLDNWLIHPTLRRHATDAVGAYAALLRRADAVVASAPASREVLQRWTPDVEVIPNGVDPEAFSEPRARPGDLPPGPVVGYAGSLAARIDAQLVVDVARALPEVAFVFIGRTLDQRPVAALRNVPNIHVLGNRHYADLPSYLQHFDVAWIPHAVGQGETGGDPIKLYEYWAAGRQTVATPIDGLERWSNQLHLVRTADEAAAAIRGLLDGTRARTPTQVPATRTWRAIADRMLTLLD